MSKPRATRHIDCSQLPVTWVDSPAWLGGIFLILFAMCWIGVALLAVLAGSGDVIIMTVVCATIGLGLLALGLWLATAKTTITIDANTISVDKRSVFGQRQWNQPLSAYTGIRNREQHNSGGKNSPSYTTYHIEMLHPENQHTVELYQSRSDDGLRSLWEDYCRQLNLPAVEGEGEHMVIRDPEDLDKSVRELVREGKIAIDFDPSAPPPEGFTIEERDRSLIIGLPKTVGPGCMVTGGLMILILPAIFIYIGFFSESGSIVFGLAGLAFLVVIIATVVWHLVARAMLEISPHQVRTFSRTRWGDTKGTTIPADQIESVRIGSPPEQSSNNSASQAVIISSDERREIIGLGLDEDALTWLRNCILAVVTL